MSDKIDQDEALFAELRDWVAQVEREDNLGGRIKKRRAMAGWSLEEFANQTANHLGRKVHFTTLSKIEKSQRNPSEELLAAIASAFNVRVEQLTGEYTQYINDHQFVVVGEDEIGSSIDAVGRPKAWMFGPDIGDAAKVFGIALDRHPLQLTLQDGAYALIDVSNPTLEDGKVFAIRHGNGELSLKRFCALPPRFDPVNGEADDEAIAIGREPFTVIGRVAWVCSPVQ